MDLALHCYDMECNVCVKSCFGSGRRLFKYPSLKCMDEDFPRNKMTSCFVSEKDAILSSVALTSIVSVTETEPNGGEPNNQIKYFIFVYAHCRPVMTYF